jgi:peptide-methionine (S)-S-oxide reductase
MQIMTQDLANETDAQPSEMATLGGGCFWCLEAVYVELKGVEAVVSGYAGGSVTNPTYREVCNGTTGHAEVVQLMFDPDVISYGDILQAFFATHDPTTLNRQGADVGTQYRSAVFYHSAAQKETAETMITQLNEAEIWPNPIVTEVVPLEIFYAAEDYHQDYYKYNSQQPYCQVVITPKLAKFRKSFAEKLKNR